VSDLSKITLFTMDALCDQGHPPIKFNCISTNPSAMNYRLDGCPLCALTARVTETVVQYCPRCDESETTTYIRGELCPDTCSDCGTVMNERGW